LATKGSPTSSGDGTMSSLVPIWKKEDLARERLRAIFVIAVVGIVAAARYFKILESFGMRLELLDWANVLDVLIGFWLVYLISMVFAISDDIFGAILGAYGRAISFGAKFVGHVAFFLAPFATLVTAACVGLRKEPLGTAMYLVFLVAVLYLLRGRIASHFSSEGSKGQGSVEVGE